MSRNAAGTSSFGKSNFGRSNFGRSNIELTGAVAFPALAFTVVVSLMAWLHYGRQRCGLSNPPPAGPMPQVSFGAFRAGRHPAPGQPSRRFRALYSTGHGAMQHKYRIAKF